jgi:hypothetical protein
VTNRWRIVAGAVLLALALAACSSGDGGGGGEGDGGGGNGGGGGTTVSADAYAKTLCTSMKSYVDDVTNLSSTFVSNLSPSADLAGQRDAVVGFLDDVLDATDRLIADLGDAGVPDVDNGQEIDAAVKRSFEQARGIIEDARQQVQDLSLDDPQAFATELSSIGTAIQDSLGSIGGSLESLDNAELSQAVADEPACASVTAGATGAS